jgi:hypothetical protein
MSVLAVAPPLPPALVNPIVAARQPHEWYSGVWIAEDISSIVDGFRSGNWIEATLGGFGATMDTLAVISDPLASLAAWGVSWLLEHVGPLREALDSLAGHPAEITAYAQAWRGIGEAVTAAATHLDEATAHDLARWHGSAADAYRAGAQRDADAIRGIARAAGGIAVIAEGCGLLVALVRGLVRDLIAMFVATLAVRLPQWLAEEALSLGFATPLVVAQVGNLVRQWATRIGSVLRSLLTSLQRLLPVLRDLESLILRIIELLKSVRGGSSNVSRMVEPAKPHEPLPAAPVDPAPPLLSAEPDGAVPHGFAHPADYATFADQLYRGVDEFYPGTRAAFQGSSVTGRSFATQKPFDVGRISDYDIALSGDKIFAAARDAGVPLRSRGTRTGPLSRDELAALGLNDLAHELSDQTGREVHFMIYASMNQAMARSASVEVPRP